MPWKHCRAGSGFDIVRNSGKATSGVTINIRGQRSLSDVKDEFGNNVANAPLFIIDGMQEVISRILLRLILSLLRC